MAGLKDDTDARILYKYDGKGTQLSQSSVQGYPEEALPGIPGVTSRVQSAN